MASFYVVAQYVPDPIIDERINIGIFVYEEGSEKVLCRFLHGWQRVKCFGDSELGFIRTFADSVGYTPAAARKKHGAAPAIEASVSKSELMEMVINWGNSIQLSEPRGSTLTADDLIYQLAPRFLKEPTLTKREHRNRLTAAKVAAVNMRDALQSRFQLPSNILDELIDRQGRITGEKEENPFDIIIGNGHPWMAMQALSFEGPPSQSREQDVTNVAWRVQDVVLSNSELPLAVAALEPFEENGSAETFDRAVNIFSSLNVPFILEDDLPDWSDRQAKRMKPQVDEFLAEREKNQARLKQLV